MAFQNGMRAIIVSVGVVSISGMVSRAHAADECGPPTPSPVFITCNGALNPYVAGITYNAGLSTFVLTLDDTVSVLRAFGGNLMGVDLNGVGANDLTLILEDGTQIRTGGLQADGARVTSGGNGNVTIVSGADISVDRMAAPTPADDPTSALMGWISSPTGTGTISISQLAGSLHTLRGDEDLGGLYGLHNGLGDIFLYSAGDIEANSPGDTYAVNGWINNTVSNGSILLRQAATGRIDIVGFESAGLYALHYGLGSAAAEAAGRINITGDGSDGVLSFIDNTAATGAATTTLLSTADVRMSGNGNYGGRSINTGLGVSGVNVAGTVVMLGDTSTGAALQQINTANTSAQSVAVTGDASITTDGTRSHGVWTRTNGANTTTIDLIDNARVQTLGALSDGVRATASNAAGQTDVSVASTVSVTALGRELVGARLDAGGGATLVNDGRIVSSGEYGAGVYARSVNVGPVVNIGPGAVVAGGWQADLGLAAGVTLPSAGVLLEFNVNSLLFNRGMIGAGSDRAVGDLAANTGTVDVQNQGQITGFVDFQGTGAHAFTNASGALFDVRHFADTDGDGVRDTKRVSISNFGAAGGTFDNQNGALVRLAPTAGNTATDATSYYVPTTGVIGRPLESSFYALSRAGIVQGQFNNINTFTNAGTVDLRGTAIGNTLLMTGGAAAGGTVPPTGGEFIADGGHLLLNTVLNDGIAPGGQNNSYSDVLIVDRTRLASAPTTITVDRREGSGAMTPGNGIMLVEVRQSADSAPGVFTLRGDYIANSEQRIVGGAYSYALYHNGVGGDAADGNWYLRNVAVAPTVPVYQEYPKVLVPLVDLPTRQQRVGNRHWRDPAAPSPEQTVFCKDASKNYRCAVTEQQASYYVSNDGSVVLESNAVWGRIEGSRSHYEAASSTVAAEYDENLWRLQAGVDGLLSENEHGRLIAGVSVHYGNVSGDVGSTVGSGKIDAQGYGVGGSLTWYALNGFYVDAQAQATWMDSDIRSSTTGTTLVDGNDGFGYALGLEVGRKFALNEKWSLTPQAQLVYSRIDFDDFTDRFNARVSLRDGDSLRARLGLAAESESRWEAADGTVSRSSFYGIANLYNEFLNGFHVSVSDVEFTSRNERLWGGIGIGGTYNWSGDKYSLYGEASASTSLRNFGDSHSFGGTLGLRARW